jgi:hypothetical protein
MSPFHDDPDSFAFLPCVVSFSNHIRGVLSGHNMKFVGLPPRKVCSFLQAVKGGLKDEDTRDM